MKKLKSLNSEILNSEILLFSIKQLSKSLNLTSTSIYNLIRANAFPAPIKVGKRSLWPKKVIEQWIDQKIRETNQLHDQDPLTAINE